MQIVTCYNTKETFLWKADKMNVKVGGEGENILWAISCNQG